MWRWQVEPRFNETDALGHINNTTLPNWFEFGRNPVTRIFVPSQRIEDWNILLRRIEVEFDAELFYGTAVDIVTWIHAIGNSSLRIRQQAWQQGQCCVRGEAVMIHLDLAARLPAPIPGDIRVQLEMEMDKANQSGFGHHES